jgi:hypothetical protein
LGVERWSLKTIEAGQTVHFGENLPTGVYFLEINAPNTPLKVVKMVKSI